MRQKYNKCLCLLVTAVLLVSLAAPDALAGETGEIPIRTAEDLITLAKNCSLDTWSQGKTVLLEADLALEDASFLPIPSFGGTFDGGGHTISGIVLPAGSPVQCRLWAMVSSGERITSCKDSRCKKDRQDGFAAFSPMPP